MPRMEGLSLRLEDYSPAQPPGAGPGGGSGPPPPPPRPGGSPLTSQELQSEKAKANASILADRSTTKPSLKPLSTAQCTSIIDAMKEVYKAKVRPFEESFRFGNFFSPLLTDADFDGKPQVLLLGQYSTGKTTFIRHLLGREYPGSNIGPEPTTDRFVVVCHGPDDRITPGNTLAVQPDKPYSGLAAFGNGFLSKFQSAACSAPLLREVSLVDTPGVLSGEKQRIERSYEFVDASGRAGGGVERESRDVE